VQWRKRTLKFSLADLTDGVYVIVEMQYHCIERTLSSGKLAGYSVTEKATQTLILLLQGYTITTSSGILKPLIVNGFVNYCHNKLFFVSEATSNNAKWTASYTGTYFRFSNVGSNTRIIGYNGSAFGAYSSANATNSGTATTSNVYDVQLYKKSTVAPSNQVAIPQITATGIEKATETIIIQLPLH
jgi:hypothetical protein